MSCLQELPTELLEKILANLEIKNLLVCQLISSCFNNTIRNSVDLDYQLLLQRSGNLDNSHCDKTTLEKRNTLDNAEFLWSSRPSRTQKLAGEQRLTNHFRVTKLLGFTDRCLIYGAREADKDESITTHLIYTLYSSNVDNLKQNSEAGVEGNDLVLNPPMLLKGSRLLGLTTDVEENGIVVVIYARPEGPNQRTFELYMVISDDRATRPGNRRTTYLATTNLEWADEIVSMDANVEMAGENVAMVIHTRYRSEGITYSFYDFAVVDWKTNRKKTTDAFLTMECQGLGFLTADHILVPSLERGSIDVFHIPTSASSEAVPDGSEKPLVKRVASFILPSLITEFNKFIDIDIHCSPNSFRSHPAYTRPSTAPNMPPTDPDGNLPDYVERPYISNAEKAIIAITMKIANTEPSADGSTALAMPRLFVHRHSLIEVLDAALALQDTTGSPDDVLTFPWEYWGPDRCRWTSLSHPDLMDGEPGSNLRKFCVYGQRYVVLLPHQHRTTEVLNTEDKTEKNMVTQVALLYDFNPLTPKILLQNRRAMREAEWVGEGPERKRRFTHSGMRLGYDYTIKRQMSCEVVLPGPLDSPLNKLKLTGAEVFNQDADGTVVGRLGFVKYCLPGLSGCADIAIDARRVIQRELKDSTDTAILGLYFG